MDRLIEVPVIDWNAPENVKADRIFKAFDDQLPIEIDGKLVIVTDCRWPKGADHIEYKTRPA